ncbi:MAG: hypothetical protein Q4B26_00975 [Eubacteriales bacterium]|nr:hypothetical protein [Eubacteriales bacterium]
MNTIFTTPSPELIGLLIDVIQDFIDEQRKTICNSEDYIIEDAAYDMLSEKLSETIQAWEKEN